MTIYQSRVCADAEAAYAILTAHVSDPETGMCVICRTAGPCQPANAAANRLVELGQPIAPPARSDRRRNMWPGWLRPYRGRREVRPNLRPMRVEVQR